MCWHHLFILLFVFFPPLLHFVVLCFMVYQIEMAIETLQKSEGLSSQRSSLLNSHVSCFYESLPSPYFDFARLTLLLFCLSQLWCLLFLLPVSIVTIAFTGCYRNAFAEVWHCRSCQTSLRGPVFLNLLSKKIMSFLVAPVAVGQLRDSRGSKSTTIHSLQSLSAPLSGAETGSCKCSLFWQTHPLHLHGTPYKAPWDKVTFFYFLFLK